MDLIPLSPFADFIATYFDDGANPWLALILAVIVHSIFFLCFVSAILAYMDRKIGADIQMRIGINRTGPFGVAQGLADGIKFIFKEDLVPNHVRGLFFHWGPTLAIVATFVAFGTIPLSESWFLSNMSWGVVFVVAMLGMVQLILFLAGYSSGSPWAIIGSFRLIALMTAFIAPVSISVLPVILITGSGSLVDIAKVQGGAPWNWLVFSYPTTIPAFVVIYAGLLIWGGRAPFDLAYGGKEIAGGLLTEYSGLRKGYLQSLQHFQVLLSSSLVVALFLGGWNVPLNMESIGRAANIVQYLVFMAKVFLLVLIGIWIRWSLPRLRVDQVLNFSWKVLVPIALLSSVGTAFWLVLTSGRGIGDFL